MQMKGTTNPPDFAREIGILKKLFRGRQDVYGTVINGEEKCIRKPLTDQIYTKHLNGATRIGVYLILPPENIVCLACIDVDEENRPKVEQIMACLLQRGFYPYLERSRAKGYHVWVFFDNPIQASVVRSILKAIMMEARISHIEIFPKQDAVASGKGVGNFIFLPLFGESVKDKRTVFLNLQFEPYQDQWDYLSKVHLTKSENVLELSNQFTLQQPPKTPAPVQNLAGPYNAYPVDGRLDVGRYLAHYGITYTRKPWNEGRTIFTFIHCLFGQNHTTKDAKGDSGIIQGPDGKPGYFCFHAHCSGRTWEDARKAISGEDSISRFYQLPIESAVMSAEDFIRLEIPRKRNILKPWLKEQSITLISGWRGTGKTWLGISILDAVTRGQQFGPWEIVTPVSSLYIDGEMASHDIQDRLMQLSKSPGVQREVPLYIYSDAYANTLGIPRASLLSDRWRDALKGLALDKGIKLLALDNISSLAPGLDENAKFDWDPINQWLLSMRFVGISTILLHHTGKDGGQRGTSAREDNVDTSILLHRPHDYVTEQGARFVIKFKKTRASMKELALLTETEFTLAEIDDQVVWTWSTVKKKNQTEILKMIDKGIPQVDVAKAIDVSKGFVSQVKTKAIEDGYLTKAGKLTPSGFVLVHSNEDDDGDG